jgi:activator of 2-hydroxyglutaryl-CoA dehydratase
VNGALGVGIDIGALTVKAVLVSNTGQALDSLYRFHQGKPLAVVREALVRLVSDRVSWIGVTGSGAQLLKSYPGVL